VGRDPIVLSSAAAPSDLITALKDALWGSGPAVFCHDPRRDPVLRGDIPYEAALVIETSGTTGSPKQVWLSKEAILSSAHTTSRAAGPEGVWWSALPAHYIAGMQVIVRSLAAGHHPIGADEGQGVVEKFAAALPQFVKAKGEGLAVYCSVVPAQLSDLLAALGRGRIDSDGLGVFDRMLVGGQRIETRLIDRAEAMGLKVTRTYGSAETAGGCVWDGAPLEGVSLEMWDGRVAISGPMLAGGYVGGDELTKEAFSQHEGKRWFLTRDLGEIRDGELHITGRVDDVIISGGVKVSLAEVERVIREDCGIDDAVVVSRAHSRWGEVPVVVTTRECDLEHLRRVTSGLLGVAAQPDAVVVVDEIPQLSSGKPDRKGLAEYAATALTYDG
jgi:O-succinylbenzoic acid--CoA ligase